MIIGPIKTEKILVNSMTLEELIDRYVKNMEERSVVVFSSKIISLIQGRIAPISQKEEAIQKEAEHISSVRNKYDVPLTIRNNAFISSAGVDESNGNGQLILLPEDVFRSAKEIYDLVKSKLGLKNFGVIIVDSHSTPLRRGATGISLGFWGFSPLRDYVGEKDLFNREIIFEKANIVDGLAAAATVVMGECAEQTPIAIIGKLDFLSFGENKPTEKELNDFFLDLDDDIFHIMYDVFKK